MTGLPLADFLGYLQGRGWTQVGRQRDTATVWAPPQGNGHADDVVVILPTREDFADYERRASQAIDDIGLAEHREGDSVAREVASAWVDTVRLRFFRPGEESLPTDELSVDDAVKVVGGAREMMLAAACAAITPQPVYPPSKPSKATDYLRHLGLGQTERGSYVLTLASHLPRPTAEELAAGTLSELPTDTFQRRVTEKLTSALCATTAAVSQSREAAGIEVFESYVSEGVSANFCDALTNIARADDLAVDVSVSWAASLSAPESRPAARITNASVPVLKAAAEVLRRTEARDDVVLEGVVERLHRTRGGGKGTVTLKATGRDFDASVRLPLSESEYLMALKAHRSFASIRVQGDLQRRGNFWTLQPVRQFTPMWVDQELATPEENE